MGCGCGKKAGVAAVTAGGRSTVYQVISSLDSSVVEEFTSLPEARAKAVAVSGRVKVTSKSINS